MKISHIMHASILVDTKGLRVLSDPWWGGPCFGAQWWNRGRPYLDALNGDDINYIYVSHGHHDHCHPGTLKTLSRNARVLVSAHLDISQSIRDLGFEVIEVDREHEQELGNGVFARIIDTCGGDTLLALTDGDEVCINLNDSLHAAPRHVQDRFCEKLRELYGTPDYLFCGYGTASHFPNCYRIPGKDYERTAIERQRYFCGQWAYLVDKIAPHFAFPFAADLVFFEDDLRWSNEPVHNGERPTEVYRSKYSQSATKTYDIAPGFVINNGVVEIESLHRPLVQSELEAAHRGEIERANRYPSVSDEQVDELVELLRENIKRSNDHFVSWPGDYRFAIFLRNHLSAIEIHKDGTSIEVRRSENRESLLSTYDVSLTTRQSYLKWSLTRPYGDEIIFVGSGGIFEYRDAQAISTDVHAELRSMIAYHSKPLPIRPAPQPTWLHTLKKFVKKLLGRDEVDLYSLSDWTFFRSI